MIAVAQLDHREQVQLNGFHMVQLYQDLGHPCADRVIEKALDDISLRLDRCEQAINSGDLVGLRKQARALSAVAVQLGLASVKGPVAQMLDAAEQQDPAACQATLSRLQRLVQRGVAAAVELQRRQRL